MKKRILSLLMVGAMTAGMLAGCGSKTDAQMCIRDRTCCRTEAF